MSKPPIATSMLVCAMVALWGCSKPEAPPTEAPTSAPGAVAGAAASKPAAATVGDCDLLTREEIERAFGGTLTIRSTSGRGGRGSGCTVTMEQGEASELVLQVGDRAAFEMRRDSFLSQTSIPCEAIDLGVEAYLVNGAQVIAIDAGGRSVSLGLTLFVFGEPMPVERDAVAAGVKELAAKVFERL